MTSISVAFPRQYPMSFIGSRRNTSSWGECRGSAGEPDADDAREQTRLRFGSYLYCGSVIRAAENRFGKPLPFMKKAALRAALHEAFGVGCQLHPVVLPQVSHFKHVPLRTRVKFPHSPHASPS